MPLCCKVVSVCLRIAAMWNSPLRLTLSALLPCQKWSKHRALCQMLQCCHRPPPARPSLFRFQWRTHHPWLCPHWCAHPPRYHLEGRMFSALVHECTCEHTRVLWKIFGRSLVIALNSLFAVALCLQGNKNYKSPVVSVHRPLVLQQVQ